MTRTHGLRRYAAAVVLSAAALCFAGGANAQTIIDDWGSATAPTAPPLKPAAVDAKTTALLVLDWLRQDCAPNPRCIAALPAEKALLAQARAKGMYVVYSAFHGAQISDTLPEVAAQPGEPGVITWADKFIDTNLDAMLKAKGIKTVIVTGTAANGAALYTASSAAQRGYSVVFPVDLVPGANNYVQQFVTWQVANGPTVGNHVTLTRANMISF
jgi:nicotinamidase-related amidase